MFAATLALAVAVGVGRFAYTPLLPLMREQAGLSQAMAGFVASANFAGYLIGALASSGSRWRRIAVPSLRWALFASFTTTAMMAVPWPAAWIAIRLAGGIASGFAFVLASILVLDRAAARGAPLWVGIFYGGVGIGIASTGLLVPAFASAAGWRGGWLGVGLFCALACAITMPWLNDSVSPARRIEATPAGGSKRGPFWSLFAAYVGEGLGYSIPATFMVAMFAMEPALAVYANWSWVLVGLVAIPSTFLWNGLGVRAGRGRAFTVALVVQAAGIVAPVFLRNALGAALCAIALGGTFLGLTALANALGREIEPERSIVAIGRLTAAFGLGQIVGPLLATDLAIRSGSYASALVAGALVLLAAAAIMIAGFGLRPQRAP